MSRRDNSYSGPRDRVASQLQGVLAKVSSRYFAPSLKPLAHANAEGRPRDCRTVSSNEFPARPNLDFSWSSAARAVNLQKAVIG
jgi:hypothetical protein